MGGGDLCAADAAEERRLKDIGTTNVWAETLTGLQFNPAHEHPQFELADLVWGCARICRYGGQIKPGDFHYSVLEHQYLMTMHALAKWFGATDLSTIYMLPELARREMRTVAMHDLPEGLIGDMVRPLKKQLPSYCTLEDSFAAKVARRYDCLHPMPAWVKDLDNRILVDERKQVMSRSMNIWASDTLQPLGVQINFWKPADAVAIYCGLLQALGVREAALVPLAA